MDRRWLLPWAIGSIAYGGASLVVPLYVVALGGDALTLGVLAGVAAVSGVPGAVVVGRMADRGGNRRGYVLGSLGLTAAMLVVMVLVSDLAIVVLANGVVWFAFAAAMPVMTVLAVHDAPARQWSERIGTLNRYQGIGWAIGLAFGLVWTGVGDRFVAPGRTLEGLLVGLGVVAAVGAMSTYRFLPGTPPTPINRTRLRTAIDRADRFTVRAVTFPLTFDRADFHGLRPRQFVERFTPSLALYFGAGFLFFTGFSAFFAPLPAFLADAGFSSDGIFALYLLSSVISALFFGYAGRLVGRFEPVDVQVAGLVARALAFPAVAGVIVVFGATALGTFTLGGVFAVIGLTWALISVTGGTIVMRLTPQTIRGESLGTYAALGALAGGIGSLLGGWVATRSYAGAFALAGGLIVAGAALVWTLRRPTD